MNSIVEQIHREFKSANDQMDRMEKLSKIGFVSSGMPAALREASIKYPGQKFLTEYQLKTLCEKWGLFHANITRFTGHIPDKNLNEMASFVDKHQTYICHKKMTYGPANDFFYIISGVILFASALLTKSSVITSVSCAAIAIALFVTTRVCRNKKAAYIEIKHNQPVPRGYNKLWPTLEFSIVAPEKMLDLKKSKKKGHKIVDDDPIILARPSWAVVKDYNLGSDIEIVRGEQSFYIIGTAWGPEAMDEHVFNERQN